MTTAPGQPARDDPKRERVRADLRETEASPAGEPLAPLEPAKRRFGLTVRLGPSPRDEDEDDDAGP